MKHPSMRHPGRWFWLFLLIPVAIGFARLRFDVEVLDLLPSNLETVQGLKLYQRYFSNARELIVTVQSPNAEQTEAAARTIAERLRPMTNRVASVIWEPPWLEHPEQAAELMAYLWFNQPPKIFIELTNRLAPQNLAATLQSTREQLAMSLSPQDIARLSYDPFGLTQLPESASGAAPSFTQGGESFSSPDGTFRILFIEANSELRTYRDCEQWLSAIQPAVQSAATSVSDKVKIGFTGRPAFVTEVAGGMQHDMTTSVGGTAAIIAILFWLAHRRVKPMLWLLALLAVILACTLALGGLIYGAINVVSVGFAAILLGLAVDYAVVHYQEALAQPELSIPQIRHSIAPSIFWAATTTITAFLVLNFGGLPGLGQLGTLVGLGVALSASIMIFEYLPPLFPDRKEEHRSPDRRDDELPQHADQEIGVSVRPPLDPLRKNIVFVASAIVLIFAFGVLVFIGRPPVDSTANALRPRGSPAYAALDEIQTNLNQQREPLWLIIGGNSVTNVAQRLDEAQAVLNRAVSNHIVAGSTLPTPLWPRPNFQAENRPIAAQLASERKLLQEAAATNGFAETSLGLTERILDTLQRAGESSGIFWPTNPMSRWIFNKATAMTPTNDFALGLVNPETTQSGSFSNEQIGALQSELPKEQVWLSGWELLGHSIFARVKENLWKVVTPMVCLVLLSLWLAFHRAREILLSLTVLLISGVCLLAVMRLAHWSWNLLNLMAIPLILGTGVDYSIFMQLALRRYNGDLSLAYCAVGRALLLCGGTAIAAFASLSWSSNAGMASLGEVCAVGIAGNMLIAVLLLPVWWRVIAGRRSS